MKKIIALVMMLLMAVGVCGCGNNSSAHNTSKARNYYAENSKEATVWAENFQAEGSKLKIYIETENGAKDPIKINDEDVVSEIKDALDLVTLGDTTDEDTSLDNYILTFISAENTKQSFTFREDGAAIIGDSVYETRNTKTLFHLCGLDAEEKTETQAFSDFTEVFQNSGDSQQEDHNEDENSTQTYSVSELCACYESQINTILEETGNKSMALSYSHGLVDDFDDDGYPEMVLAYSTDVTTLRACVMRLDTTSGVVLIQDFEVAQLAGAAGLTICQGTLNNEACIVIWYSNYGGGDYGTYFVMPLQSENKLAITAQVDYRLDTSGENGSFSLNGKEMTSEEYLEFISGINYSLAGFGEGESGTLISEMIPIIQ